MAGTFLLRKIVINKKIFFRGQVFLELDGIVLYI